MSKAIQNVHYTRDCVVRIEIEGLTKAIMSGSVVTSTKEDRKDLKGVIYDLDDPDTHPDICVMVWWTDGKRDLISLEEFLTELTIIDSRL